VTRNAHNKAANNKIASRSLTNNAQEKEKKGNKVEGNQQRLDIIKTHEKVAAVEGSVDTHLAWPCFFGDYRVFVIMQMCSYYLDFL